ncbi:MAG: hypothetical protein V4858_08925 [Pseudomonadota bacterium]
MTRRNWKRVRPTSMTEALRLCKEYAQERGNLSVERIADRMGVSHDSLYKWLASGRLPSILIPTYEHVCGCCFVTEWLAVSTGKLLIDMPTGSKGTPEALMEVNTSCATALQLLTAFYAAPKGADPEETLAALRKHLEQIAFHQHNVASYATPELDFSA